MKAQPSQKAKARAAVEYTRPQLVAAIASVRDPKIKALLRAKLEKLDGSDN